MVLPRADNSNLGKRPVASGHKDDLLDTVAASCSQEVLCLTDVS